jgi:hypothetical protein
MPTVRSKPPLARTRRTCQIVKVDAIATNATAIESLVKMFRLFMFVSPFWLNE